MTERQIDLSTITEYGCAREWEKHCKKEARITGLLSVLSLICIISAIILGIAFIIYIIASGIRISNDLQMFAIFRTETPAFTITVSVLVALGNFYDKIGDYCELFECSQWFSNNINTTQYGLIASGRKEKKNFGSDVRILYHAIYPQKVTKTILIDLTVTLITCGLTVTAGVLAAPAINQYVILQGTEYFDIYATAGFLIGAIASVGIATTINNFYKHATEKRYKNKVLQ